MPNLFLFWCLVRGILRVLILLAVLGFYQLRWWTIRIPIPEYRDVPQVFTP